MGSQGIAISLFSGAGGLDLGAERAGYEVRAAVEMDRDAAATMEKNFTHLAAPVIQKDILETPTREILEAAGLTPQHLARRLTEAVARRTPAEPPPAARDAQGDPSVADQSSTQERLPE